MIIDKSSHVFIYYTGTMYPKMMETYISLDTDPLVEWPGLGIFQLLHVVNFLHDFL